jgi:hypothetical protein
MKARNKRPKIEDNPQELTSKKKRKRLRVPRPMGATALCKEYNQGSDQSSNPSLPHNKDLLRKIHRLYLNSYMNNQLIEYDNITKEMKLMGLNKLAYLLNTTQYDIMTMLAKEMSRSGLLLDRQKAEVARGSFLNLFFEASEISAQSSHQLAILMASQGGKYRPFISGEVNRAMANRITAMKPKMDLLKLMLDAMGGLNGPTQSEKPNTTQGTLMTTDMAHNLLNDQGFSVMTNPEYRDNLLSNEPTLKLLPETNPNYQGGDILRSASLYKDVPEDVKLEADHTVRNRARQGFDEQLDEEDFKA